MLVYLEEFMLYKRAVIQEGCACITRLRIGCNLLFHSG